MQQEKQSGCKISKSSKKMNPPPSSSTSATRTTDAAGEATTQGRRRRAVAQDGRPPTKASCISIQSLSVARSNTFSPSRVVVLCPPAPLPRRPPMAARSNVFIISCVALCPLTHCLCYCHVPCTAVAVIIVFLTKRGPVPPLPPYGHWDEVFQER